MYPTQETRVLHGTFADNIKGINIQNGKEGDDLALYLEDIHVYGETEAEDCPVGGSCKCVRKFGFMLGGSNQSKKDLHPTMASALPIFKTKSAASWGTVIDFNNLHFHNFAATTRCGAVQRIFEQSYAASDYTPLHYFKNVEFDNVADAAMSYLFDPPKNWAKISDCGEWPCTAPSNVVMDFEGTSYSGAMTPSYTAADFQIVSDFAGVSDTYDNCVYKDAWNAWRCANSYLGVLLAESLDGDTWDRSVQPILITNEETGYSNKLNSAMDHVWDGFYTGQLRLSRFPAQIHAQGDYTW